MYDVPPTGLTLWSVPTTTPSGAIMLTIDVMTRLDDVKAKTAEALRAAEADQGASVVLVAVVKEFDSKTDKAIGQSVGESAALPGA